jgi:SRSO17 transposase
VARQYCGQLGKQDNCQVAVSLSIANPSASLPIAYQLYLPEDWAKDPIRRAKAGVPAEIAFATKAQIAFRQIEATLAAGVPRGVVLMDAGYGADTDLRDAITALGLTYSAGLLPNTTVWPQGRGPLPPKEWSGRGRRPTRLRRDAEHQPVDVKTLALGLPDETWQTVTWREGSALDMTSRFARVRVRPAHRDERRSEPRPEEWLLIEWPEGASEPIKYWFSTLAEDISLVEMVDITKLRWRIERDYHDLKQEVGLGHYEGRGWRGFHHHATLCIAAYAFLISERETIPPSGSDPAPRLGQSSIHSHHRPRGAPGPTRTPRLQLYRIHAPTAHGRSRQKPAKMSMLPRAPHHPRRSNTLVTQ